MKRVIIALLAMAVVGEITTNASKLISIKQGEPPAKSPPGDHEDKTIKEKEEQAKDIANAKNAPAEAVKAAADQAANDLKGKEKEWAKLPLKADGLQHWPDGRVFNSNGEQVAGVNQYAQKI